MKKVAILALVLVVVSGCKTVKKASHLELIQMNEPQLCEQANAHEHDFLTYHLVKSKKFNCHPAQQKCISGGIDTADENYQSCVKSNLDYLSFPPKSSFDNKTMEEYFGPKDAMDCTIVSRTISCEVK